MKWTHILDAQPMVGRTIVMFSRDFTPRDLRRYRLYQRNYIDHRSIKNVAWEEFIKEEGMGSPGFLVIQSAAN